MDKLLISSARRGSEAKEVFKAGHLSCVSRDYNASTPQMLRYILHPNSGGAALNKQGRGLSARAAPYCKQKTTDNPRWLESAGPYQTAAGHGLTMFYLL